MSSTVIRIENLSKRYDLTHRGGSAPYLTMRDAIYDGVKHAATSFFTRADPNNGSRPRKTASTKEEFWALRDLDMEIRQGDRLGIIGRNGAGKSTLLKILSRIVPPTKGRISIKGRVASLLEVGTGFHPELTGRENIFLNGAVLGMRAQEIRSKFDEIVAFAEVDRFLDTPVKRYSSGMYVRLAFAVAAHLESEILIVDEVLAVGDARFQKKCMGKMEDVSSKEGRTVLFVSHNMGAVRALCTKSAWLEKGAMRKIGPSPEVVLGYLEDSSESEGGSLSRGKEHEPLYFKKVVIRDLQGRETRTLLPDEPLTVEVHYFANKPISRPNFWIDVIGPYGHLFGASMIFDNLCPEMIIGEGMVTCRFGKIRLLPQTYTITLRAKGTNGIDVLTPTIPDAGIFQVTGTAKDFDMPGEAADQYLEHDTPIIVPYEWVMPNGKVLRPQWQSSDAQFGVIPQRMERGREQ